MQLRPTPVVLALSLAFPLAAPLAAQALAGKRVLTKWDTLAHDLFKELIEINTQESNGSSLVAAKAMAARLKRAGFPDSDVVVVENAPRKGNLIARLHGKPATKKPIMLLSHLDVVEAKPEDWTLPPFTFVEKDSTFYGRGVSDDKDDGAKWLVSEKLADPKRIAMFGFSYGGYSAFAAAVRPNGLYKCAIAGAGVSDIERIGARLFTNPFFRSAQEPTMRGLNPLAQADKIQIPIMVYHGDRDQTVPLMHSELFVDKAKAAGKPVEYHVLNDYAHGPAWTRKVNIDQLSLISDYLSKGCGGGGL